MVVLRCKISGYMLQSLKIEKGSNRGFKYVSTYTLNVSEALNLESMSHADVWCHLINSQSPAPLPYEFDEGIYVDLEVVKLRTLEFESEQEG